MRVAFNGLCLAIVKTEAGESGTITVMVTPAVGEAVTPDIDAE